MSTQVTLTFVTDAPAGELNRFLHDVIEAGGLNSRDNEEGRMITLRDLKYRTEQAHG